MMVEDGTTMVRRRWGVAPVVVAMAVAAAVVVGVVASGSGRPTVAEVDRLLVDRYLEPLRAAGIPFEIDQTCHYRTLLDDEPWHLEIQLTVGAGAGEVADALRGTIEHVGTGAYGYWTLQDVRNEPEAGWNAQLREDAPDVTHLGAVFNNVERDLDGNVGWQATCAFPR